ncbi:hypothetical protein BGX28_001769 [Mortierella sp. GBA30]|nr:hypothetical protein BGX28_001769 [Mortierella sp. GBA30]
MADPADSTRCNSLLNNGEWLNHVKTQWQPKGCILKTYDASATNSCIGGSRIVMIGDSIVRQLFYTVVKKVMPDVITDVDRHSFLYFKDPALNTTFEFYWDPFLTITGSLSASGMKKTPTRKPSVLLVGSGLWYLRHADTSGGITKWREMMQNRIDQMKEPSPSDVVADHIFITPISAVNTDKLSNERLKTLLPSDIRVMNSFLKEATSNTSISIPFSWTFMTETSTDATVDGLHYEEKIVTAEVDVMLNYLCNNKLPKEAPMAATCCYEYPSNKWSQTLMLTVFFLWLPLGQFAEKFRSQHLLSSILPRSEVLQSVTVMAAAVIYMYSADRSALFAKNNKSYSSSCGILLLFVSILAGCLTLKKSDKTATFLNRAQTDEWKGWMQLAILIYHYMGASGVSAVYNPIRILVASYLFMTGYGHFTYFYRKADFGFERMAAILVRLNLLSIILAYTMDTTYLSYYFAPLVSFFYLVIHAMMYICHVHNRDPIFIISKITLTAIITALFVWKPFFINAIFDALKFAFGINWSASEWHFRLQLDVWIVFVGAFVGYGSIKVQELALTDHPHWHLFRQGAIILSLLGLLGFFHFATQIHKLEYNLHHPFISWIPILGFVTLRNCTATLRSTTSAFFEFIGKCSLETFIAQYHIWLASDTKGILVITPWVEGPAARIVNFILTTLLFIVISNALRGATNELSDWMIRGRSVGLKGIFGCCRNQELLESRTLANTADIEEEPTLSVESSVECELLLVTLGPVEEREHHGLEILHAI